MRETNQQLLIETQEQIQYCNETMIDLQKYMSIAMFYLILAGYKPNYH